MADRYNPLCDVGSGYRCVVYERKGCWNIEWGCGYEGWGMCMAVGAPFSSVRSV